MKLIDLTMMGCKFCQSVILSLGLMVSCDLYADVSLTMDPTKPPAEVLAKTLGVDEAHSDNIVLNGIKEDGKASFAILNDTLVRIGETYKGHRLIAVHQAYVILEDELKQKLKLSLNMADFKKSTTGVSSKSKNRKRQPKFSHVQN